MGRGIGLCITYVHGPVPTTNSSPSLVHPCDVGHIDGLDFLPTGSYGRAGIGHDRVVIDVGTDSIFAVAYQASVCMAEPTSTVFGRCSVSGHYRLVHGVG